MEITRVHQQFFANNLRSKWDKDVGLVSLRLSPQGASNDAWFDLRGSPSDLALTWPEVKFWPWFFTVKLYMVDAPWREKHNGIKIVALPSKWKILSSKNRFGEFVNWPLATSMLTWAKKWPIWFRNDFSWAFERRFPFCSTMRRSRDRRVGCVQTPPIRWWKIQRPIRARVKKDVIVEKTFLSNLTFWPLVTLILTWA